MIKYNRVQIGKSEIITEVTYQAYYPMLSGKYVLHAVLHGRANYMIEKRQVTLLPGSFIFLNPDTCYSIDIDSVEEVSTCSIFFDADFVRDFEYTYLAELKDLLDNPVAGQSGQSRFMESIHFLTGAIKLNLQQLCRYMENGTNDQLLLTEYLNHCLINYYILYHSEIVKREASLKFLSCATRTEILRRLSIAKDYMISNYNKNIRLDDIAQVACLSVNHLLRTFKQAYQQSPHQFLTQIRLQQAKHLLKSTAYPVNEIVDIVGFECPSSFIRLFRNSFKVTPGQYR
jgi:AraC family transcriptional regulator